MAKTKKVYTTTVADGRITIKLDKSVDGKTHTASAPYPFFIQQYNEELNKNEIKRLTKAQTEKWLFEQIKQYVPAKQGRRKRVKTTCFYIGIMI